MQNLKIVIKYMLMKLGQNWFVFFTGNFKLSKRILSTFPEILYAASLIYILYYIFKWGPFSLYFFERLILERISFLEYLFYLASSSKIYYNI